MASEREDERTLSGPEIENKLRRLDLRSAGLWVTASILMLLLTGAVYAAALPEITARNPDSEMMLVALRSLVGLVLLFNAFAVYQQVTMRRFRRTLSAELQRVRSVENRNELLEKISNVDQLTELYNRRYLEERLPLEFARADRGEYPLTIVLLDLNYFKEINDQFGHAAGDAVLQAFSVRIRHAIRNIDIPIRLGGDEFLLCLPECSQDQVPPILDRLRKCSAEYNGRMLPVEFAAGWAERRADETWQALLERADQAMYVDKAECHKRTGAAAR